MGLLLLYVVQCVIGSWVHRTPAEDRTGAQGALLAILGATIIILSFVETWLGIVSTGRNKLVWFTLLFVSPLFLYLSKMKNEESVGRPGYVCAWRYDGAEKIWRRAGGGREGRVCAAGHACSAG